MCATCRCSTGAGRVDAGLAGVLAAATDGPARSALPEPTWPAAGPPLARPAAAGGTVRPQPEALAAGGSALAG